MKDRRKNKRTAVRKRRGRKGRQPLNDLGEKRRCCNLKEEALDCTLWRTRFVRFYGLATRQNK
jgi:hypothetical protein